MFSKIAGKQYDPRRWSLQNRLTIFFAVSTTAILLFVSCLLYNSLQSQFKTEDEMELMQATRMVGKAIYTVAAERDSPSWRVTWEHTVESRKKLLVRVYTPEGTLFVKTKEMPVPSAAFPPVSPPDYSRWKNVNTDKRYLLTSFQVEVAPSRIWRVEAAYDFSQSQTMLNRFKHQLAIFLAVALIITLSISWGITSFGLRPLRKVSNVVQGISSENLSYRIGDRPWPKEVMVLATGFDEMLARLEAAFLQLSRFSADLAHEVRTPINNMLTAASVTLTRDRNHTEYQSSLESIVKETEHLIQLVESMLLLARTENAETALQTEQLSAAEEFERLTDFFEAFASAHQIELVHEGNAHFTANPELLRRALSNLIDNAIRYTPPAGIITLSATQDAHSAVLTVQDTGSGIEEHHLEHIFERFYRADTARSQRVNVGLGLSLVKAIITLHEGSITVQSRPGEGARFTIIIPA